MKKKQTIIETKQLLYVQIYDELYKRIMTGEFPEGSFLPSEPKLAEILNASRVTIRQALSLLNEDGLVKSIQGRGNMVTRPMRNAPDGLEKIAHPVYRCCDQTPDNVEMDSHLELPTDYMKAFFQHKTTAVMVVGRWYTYLKELLAYSVSFIPVESAPKLDIDLADSEALFALLEKGVYETAVSSVIEVKIAATSSFITERYQLPEDAMVSLLQENLYFGEKYPYIYNKHYLITPDHSIRINGERQHNQ